MRKGRAVKLARFLILAGILLQFAAAMALMSVDPLLEYAIPAPDVRVENGLKKLIESQEEIKSRLGEDLSVLSIGGQKSGVTIAGGGRTVVAALRAVNLRWLETCPRRLLSGRWMDSGELKSGAKVAVLDADLAFALFGSEDAEGKEIIIAGERYAILGTVRHHRSVGEADAYGAYIPLMAAVGEGLQLDVLAMRALGVSPAGMEQSFVEAMRSVWGDGELHNLRKERMGAMLLTRLMLCGFGMALVLRAFRRFAARIRWWWMRLAALRMHSYARDWLGPALLRGLGALLGGVLLLAAVYGLLSLAIEPVYSFTEWVPESLVSVAALRRVFWDRAAHAARSVSLRTPESARVAFWGTIARVGAVLTLIGFAKNNVKIREPIEERHGLKDKY